MDTAELKSLIPSEAMDDTQAVVEHLMSGRPLPDEIVCRIRERAACITRKIRENHGVLDIGVPAIRALRDS